MEDDSFVFVLLDGVVMMLLLEMLLYRCVILDMVCSWVFGVIGGEWELILCFELF